MSESFTEAAQRAREYYDGPDADEFYFDVWGGQDIHVGIYNSRTEDIRDASHRTVRMMAGASKKLSPEVRVLDMGSGYGGSARYLAKTFGCQVECLNISKRQNERTVELNKEADLDDQIGVNEGSFENLPFPDDSFDVVWSQDALLHSGNRQRALAEVARVLKPGGEFLLADPMQAQDCPEGVLGPILERIHLDSLGSFEFYRQAGEKVGLDMEEKIDLSENLPRHYGRVYEELDRRNGEIVAKCSEGYVKRMMRGLQHWVEAGHKRHLNWGIMRFRKK